MRKKVLFPVMIGMVAIIVVLILHFLKEPGEKWDISGFTESEFTNTIGMELVRIEPGSFQMGQSGPRTDYNLLLHYSIRRDADGNRIFGVPEDVGAGWDEVPVREVTISRPFYIGATEVTLGQYRQFRPGHQPDRRDDEAATELSWHDAVAFCEWLSEKEGRPYRLPSEAEWEYACRAGTTTIFNTGDRLPEGFLDWFEGETFPGQYRRTHYFPDDKLPAYYSIGETKVNLRVSRRALNAWGLYDMHGNVAEWCADWYGPYEAGAVTDPLGRREGDFRVFRGGSHSSMERLVRSANRAAWLPESKSDFVGFRVVLGKVSDRGALLPPPTPPLNARNVSQSVPEIKMQEAAAPFFSGPQPYVKVPEDSNGPLFFAHNHSPSITECPNGDMLAVWFSTVLEGGSELSNAASRLRFGESKWETASLFWDGPGVNDHAPKLWWDGNNILFNLAMGFQENIIRTSTDNGANWSKARPIFSTKQKSELGVDIMRIREGFLVISMDINRLSLLISRDGGRTWETTGGRTDPGQVRPGGTGPRHAGVHAPVVQLNDGRLMAIGRFYDLSEYEKFEGMAPVSYSSDWGETWTYEKSEFPPFTSTQRATMIRLREGPIAVFSFTDIAKDFGTDRKGMTFTSENGTFTGYGLYAALSFDEGKSWPVRRLITPGGEERQVNSTNTSMFTLSDTYAEFRGYLSATQARDGRIHLISSKNHYVFNLAWLKELPSDPGCDSWKPNPR